MSWRGWVVSASASVEFAQVSTPIKVFATSSDMVIDLGHLRCGDEGFPCLEAGG